MSKPPATAFSAFSSRYEHLKLTDTPYEVPEHPHLDNKVSDIGSMVVRVYMSQNPDITNSMKNTDHIRNKSNQFMEHIQAMPKQKKETILNEIKALYENEISRTPETSKFLVYGKPTPQEMNTLNIVRKEQGVKLSFINGDKHGVTGESVILTNGSESKYLGVLKPGDFISIGTPEELNKFVNSKLSVDSPKISQDELKERQTLNMERDLKVLGSEQTWPLLPIPTQFISGYEELAAKESDQDDCPAPSM